MKNTVKKGHICDAINQSDEPNIEVLYDLSELFKVFGDSTRIRILTALTGGEMCVLHLSEHLGMGQSAVSHQLRQLRESNLVKTRRDGKVVYYSLSDEHVREIFEKAVEKVSQGKYKYNPTALFSYILKTGEKTLAKTPELLPVLKEANVVDAGGYGFLFLISGMQLME